MNELAAKPDLLPLKAETNARLDVLEAFAKTCLPPAHETYEHLIHGGMYARTMRCPAGALVVGLQLKKETILVAHGAFRMLVGDHVVGRFEGTNVLAGAVGRRALILCETDCVFTSLNVTRAATVAEAEAEVVDDPSRLASNKLLEGH